MADTDNEHLDDQNVPEAEGAAEMEAFQNEGFDTLLIYLKSSRGFDFSGYKRSSLERRIRKRMQDVRIGTYPDYQDYLEVHPEEFAFLFNVILINVTTFFRDTEAWNYVSKEVVPRLLAGKSPNEPIRVWSAACASGQEAYTLAIVLAEHLGVEQFRKRVKIYATDVDEEALTEARQATYSARDVTPIPPALLERYFERVGERFVFHRELRRSIIFGRNNLLQDVPISRLDLLVCRNALMYFNAEIQARILARMHFALNPNGHLFVGKAEMLFTHASLFVPLSLKYRIFTPVAHGTTRRLPRVTELVSPEEDALATAYTVLRDVAFDAGPVAQIVQDDNQVLVLINDRARSLFRLSVRDVGSRLRDLVLSYQPVELRSLIEQVSAERRPVTIREVPWNVANDTVYLDVQILPLTDPSGVLLGTSISFTDVSRYRKMQDELQESGRELETAYEELQSSNEELETTNEELQSSNEELETTNEELQATNEELETTNEELQATNEEAQAMNEEVRQRSEQLRQMNVFMDSILASLLDGVVVLDTDLRVQVWSHRSEDLWGLRGEEVQGRNFLNLDIGLPVDQLRSVIRGCLTGDSDSSEIFLEARNRRGRTFQCQVTCTPLIGEDGEVSGVVILMREARPPAA